MKATIEFSDDQIRSLLCSAFEGGSNYWYQINGVSLPACVTVEEFRYGGPLYDDSWPETYMIPFAPDCALVIADMESDKAEYRLDRQALGRGMQVMAKKYPCHFADVLNETGDATTGDVYLQCCLFGELIYG
jgi:hypothetical protein